MQIKESFKPKANKPPDTFFNSIRFYLRLVLDLQTASIYRDLKSFLKNTKGNFLDLGCGDSPYRFLLNKKTNIYHGVDIYESENFEYQRTDVTHFDGQNIPFNDNHFDNLICTEVLEHVREFQVLINEVNRVLKPGGSALFTIPWSARYHYIPNDFYRYTPSALEYIFKEFSSVNITHRGTDITAISSKLMVIYFRNLLPSKKWQYFFFPFFLALSPLIVINAIIGHLSLACNLGSNLDPLGYTIVATKQPI
jgi:ubiquinone/menaquinone biosynthesis C-methylase UbiE